MFLNMVMAENKTYCNMLSTTASLLTKQSNGDGLYRVHVRAPPRRNQLKRSCVELHGSHWFHPDCLRIHPPREVRLLLGLEALPQACLPFKRPGKRPPLWPFEWIISNDSHRRLNTFGRHWHAQRAGKQLAKISHWSPKNPGQINLHQFNVTSLV